MDRCLRSSNEKFLYVLDNMYVCMYVEVKALRGVVVSYAYDSTPMMVHLQ